MKTTGYFSKEKQQVFSAFCNYLNQQVLELNNSELSAWKDRDGKLHSWRTVEVERAMFHLAQHSKG